MVVMKKNNVGDVCDIYDSNYDNLNDTDGTHDNVSTEQVVCTLVNGKDNNNCDALHLGDGDSQVEYNSIDVSG